MKPRHDNSDGSVMCRRGVCARLYPTNLLHFFLSSIQVTEWKSNIVYRMRTLSNAQAAAQLAEFRREGGGSPELVVEYGQQLLKANYTSSLGSEGKKKRKH
jgi:hypothetical protein